MSMVINANTKIGAILKHNPATLEAIISISPKFEKLRNPLLRKIMVGRTSVSTASKIGGCRIEDLFAKLKPLGFETDNTIPIISEEKKETPDFFRSLHPEQIIVLDVRPVIAAGEDPLSAILEKIKTLQNNQVLKIQNSFEPAPLMHLLRKQGFESYVEEIDDNLVETYFYRKSGIMQWEVPPVVDTAGNWNEILVRFNGKLQSIDVRNLQMPLPMITILETLDKLPAETALFVYHKRIPVFLLPELAQRQFDYRIKEISDGEVHLLIFKM